MLLRKMRTILTKQVIMSKWEHPPLFDEAHITADSNNAPLAAQALQQLRYANFDNEYKDGKFTPDATIKIK